MKMEIVAATAADLPEILALQKQAYQSEGAIYDDYSLPPLLESMEDLLKVSERCSILKAVSGGVLVGSVRAYLQDGTCHIGRLMVRPGYRNQGIGTKLMQTVEACFERAESFELFTGHKSERNLHLYRKLGYLPFKTEEVTPNLSLIHLKKRQATPVHA